ncbi:hypothetical protein V490_01401 [Pseudogymnoascus sp. VKM F-3557]|nr:hypothetical protein V490_01401 [Pseudogymnoascus sp. VKM F-3557]
MKGPDKKQRNAGPETTTPGNINPVYDRQQRLPTSSCSPMSQEYSFEGPMDSLEPSLPSSISVASHNDAASQCLELPVCPETYGSLGLVPQPAASEYSYDDWPNKRPRIQLSVGDLLPLMEMFFDHLFPIMPVLERNKYLDSKMLEDQVAMSPGEYALLTAVSALTIVQLSLPGHFVPNEVPTISAGMLIEECLRIRHKCNYIETPNLQTVLTSFFLFGYYGNLEKHNQARHFLHEAISFAEAIKLDDEIYLSQLDTRQEQWYRRTFWLLFITERAYALQQQNRIKIQTTLIKLPAVFGSEEPQLLYGFVNLVNLFLVIDSTFLSMVNSTSKSADFSKTWLVEVLRKLSSSSMTCESLETHQLDILVSRQWLQMLLWQLSVKQGLLTTSSTEEPFNLQYPILLARDVVKTISSVNQESLDCHGIGMEQKLADIAACLTDVLKCAEGDMSEPYPEGREYLKALFKKLSRMRGAQSRGEARQDGQDEQLADSHVVGFVPVKTLGRDLDKWQRDAPWTRGYDHDFPHQHSRNTAHIIPSRACHELQVQWPDDSVVRDLARLAKRQAPALQSPAAHVEHTRDNGVLLHRVLDVETHLEILLVLFV